MGGVSSWLPVAAPPPEGHVDPAYWASLVGESSMTTTDQLPGKLPLTTLAPYAIPAARPPIQLLASSLFFPSSSSDDTPSSLLVLTLDSIVRPRIDDYLQRIQPMIPVFDRDYIEALLADPIKLKNREHAAMLLAMTALSLVHPLSGTEIGQRPKRMREAAIFADEALRLGRRWDFGQTAAFEACMASYLLFGLLHEMDAGHGAQLRLVEAVSLGETMKLGDAETYRGLSETKTQQRMTLYWVLGVTERCVEAPERSKKGAKKANGCLQSPRNPTERLHHLSWLHLCATRCQIDANDIRTRLFGSPFQLL